MKNTEVYRKRLTALLMIMVAVLTVFIGTVGRDILSLRGIVEEAQLEKILHSIYALMLFVIFYGVVLLYYIRKLQTVVYRDIVEEMEDDIDG